MTLLISLCLLCLFFLIKGGLSEPEEKMGQEVLKWGNQGFRGFIGDIEVLDIFG
jgi:hypothetical protein